MIPRVPAATPAADLVEALVHSTFHVMGVLTRVGAEHDLSLTQLRVLGLLRDRRPRMTELAAFLGLDKSTMTGLVDRAERRGLMERGRNAGDKRVIDVYLTEAGLELAQRVYEESVRHLTPLIDHLTPEQHDEFVRLFEILLAPSPDAHGGA